MGEFINDSGTGYFAKEWLDKLRLSAHYLICPSGVVIQTRENDQIAYHAKSHNTGSIGIEILVPGVHDYRSFIERIKTPYVHGTQYTALVELCRGFKHLNFTRHSDIDPDRKADPGAGFDWQTFIQDVG